MRELTQQRGLKELVAEFANEDIASWPASRSAVAAEAFYLRGRAYRFLKQGEQAEADLQAAVKLAPRNGPYWLTLAENASANLNDPEGALAAYQQAYEISGGGNGWLAISATLGAAGVLVSELQNDEALKLLQRYETLDGMAKTWRIPMLRAYGKVFAAQSRDAEALAKFREALKLEQ